MRREVLAAVDQVQDVQHLRGAAVLDVGLRNERGEEAVLSSVWVSVSLSLSLPTLNKLTHLTRSGSKRCGVSMASGVMSTSSISC